MNGAQDLGGMMGFGPIQIEQDEPWFHAAWERRAFGLTLAMGATGSWNIDMSQHALPLVTGSARATCIPKATPVCRAMPVARLGSWSWCMAPTCSRMRMHG